MSKSFAAATVVVLIWTVLDRTTTTTTTIMKPALAFDVSLYGSKRLPTKRNRYFNLSPRNMTKRSLLLLFSQKIASSDPDNDSDSDATVRTVNGRFNKQPGNNVNPKNINDNRSPLPRSVDFPPFVVKAASAAVLSDEDVEDYDLVALTIRDDDRNVISQLQVPQNKKLAKPPPLSQPTWWLWSPGSFPWDDGRWQKSTQNTRMRNDRSYARKGSFVGDRLRLPPGLYDLSTPPCPPKDAFWISIPARFVSYAVTYYAFPWVTKFVDSFVTMPRDQLEDITSNFGPGISILYGTFISLTLSILYNRKGSIQETVSMECASLALLTRRIISLLEQQQQFTVQAGQALADQVRMLAQSSRGKELMVLMYTDPYARLNQVLDEYEDYATPLTAATTVKGNNNKISSSNQNTAGRVAQCRDLIKDLYRIRANRLSDESLALPPTHFVILNLLTLMMLLGYTVSIIPTVDRLTGIPSNESCLLFAFLSTIYLLFYNFANDLNEPFQGVYQIRRSTAAGHLLQMRWFLANHPILSGNIDFTEPEIDPDAKCYRVATPNLGDFWFEEG
jgi:Protein of unknown function (DUF4239)